MYGAPAPSHNVIHTSNVHYFWPLCPHFLANWKCAVGAIILCLNKAMRCLPFYCNLHDSKKHDVMLYIEHNCKAPLTCVPGVESVVNRCKHPRNSEWQTALEWMPMPDHDSIHHGSLCVGAAFQMKSWKCLENYEKQNILILKINFEEKKTRFSKISKFCVFRKFRFFRFSKFSKTVRFYVILKF